MSEERGTFVPCRRARRSKTEEVRRGGPAWRTRQPNKEKEEGFSAVSTEEQGTRGE